MERDDMIDALVADDLDTIFADNGDHGDSWMIDNILRAGFKGYENISDEELEQELRERGLYDDDENVDIELDPFCKRVERFYGF